METILFPHLAQTSLCQPLPVQEGKPVFFQCLTVYLGFSLLEKGSVVPVEEALQAAGSAIGTSVLDLGLPKQRAEWLCAGCAVAMDGALAHSLVASVRVGSHERSFLVLGDRADNGLGVASPAPFERMPLDWQHTYGGSCCPENPKGLGADQTKGPCALANVLGLGPQGTVMEARPACPLPLDPVTRKQPCGTFDADWLARLWPAPPVDFDWTWYNLAQEEQRRDMAFEGLEEIRVLGMHEQGELVSSLPGLRVRLFAEYTDKDGMPSRAPGWHEFAATSDTVWLFPNQGLGLQLWHGLVPARDERGTDIARILLCHERADGPRHELTELWAMKEELDAATVDKAAGPEDASQKTVADEQDAAQGAPNKAQAPQVPDNMASAPRAQESPEPQNAQGTRAKSSPTLEETLEAARQTACAELGDMLDTINPLLERQGLRALTREEVEREIARQSRLVQEFAAHPQAGPEADSVLLGKALQKAGLSPEYGKSLEQALALTPPRAEDFADKTAFRKALEAFGDRFALLARAPASVRDNLVRQLELAATGRALPLDKGPDLENALRLAGLQGNGRGLEEALARLEQGFAGDTAMLSLCQDVALALGLDPQLVTGQMNSLLASTRSSLYQTDLVQDQLARLLRAKGESEDKIRSLFSQIAAMHKDKGQDLAELAKTCGVSDTLLDDIRALDPLPIQPVADPIPDRTEESSTASSPKEVQATETDEDAAAHPPMAPEKDNEEADANKPLVADFSGQDLSGTSFANLDLSGALFDGAILRFCDFSGCNLQGADLSGADLTGASLEGAMLDGASLCGCLLREASLANVKARDADFSRCVFKDTVLTGLEASTANFADVVAQEADFSGCLLDRALFDRASLAGARFKGARLAGASFEQCDLHGAMFWEAHLVEARLYFCTLDEASLVKANLARSNWLSCQGKSLDARCATLAGALLETCVLQEANLAGLAARECRFLSCDLLGSDLRCADLLFGALRDCRVGNCDVRGANLFGADLLYLAVNDKTRLEGANIARTSLARGIAP